MRLYFIFVKGLSKIQKIKIIKEIISYFLPYLHEIISYAYKVDGPQTGLGDTLTAVLTNSVRPHSNEYLY